MTDSAGTPAGPEGPTDAAAAGAPGGPDRPAGARSLGRRRLLRLGALGAAVVLLAGAGIGWVAYEKLEDNIRTDRDTADQLREWEAERPKAMVNGAQNILLIGSDTRADGNGEYGRDSGTQRSDTTILLHLAADRRSATAVSIPRDLMLEIPRCRTAGGRSSAARFAQFNGAFEFGGAACTIRTVENLTGVRIDHHMIVDFLGFKKMVNAVHGVDVCLKKSIKDPEAHLKLSAGRHRLNGEQALGYVRTRYSVGDGSDTERMERQQRFLASLVKKVQSNGVLLNPARLYPVLDAATSSLTTDSGLDSLRKLYDLVRSMRSIPTEKVQFLTVPRRPYSLNANRDELVQPDAAHLFNALRNDLRVTVSARRRPAEPGATQGGSGSRAPADRGPGAAPTGAPPTYRGTTAATNVCG